MSTLGVAAIQLAGRKSGNLDLVEEEMRLVARRFPWVDLIVLGELAICGARTEAAEPPGGPSERRLAALARELGVWLAPGSLYERRAAGIFNTAPVIDPDGNIVARHDKMFPFRPYEKNVEAGTQYCVFDIPGAGRLGLAICYDMWFPEVIRTLSGMGAEAILLPTMTNTIDRDVEIAIARANAAVNQCYFIDVNVAGEQGNGRSAFFGPGGELLHECGTGREIVALEIDFEQARRARERGWHGLGQVLKSFRDSAVEFPLHASAPARRRAMDFLGELRMPDRASARRPSGTRAKAGKLSIIE